MNLISFNPNFARILLLSTAFVVSINTIAGGRSSGRNLMDDYLQNKTSTNPDASATPSQRFILISNNALVFNRGATGVDNDDFDKKFSLAKTLTNIRNTSNATTDSSNKQLLNSLLTTLNVDSKTNGFVTMDLQKRAQEAALSELADNMSPTAIFNRFDLSASNGQHCGEYRVVYHKNNGNRFFLSFEAKYPNPEIKKGKAGCFAVADFWKEIGGMSKTDALAQLEKFFYQGLEHKGVQLPAAINFAHYTHGTGQVRSNTFVNNLWQYREFKADINAKGENIFVVDSVKSNSLDDLFADERSLDSDSLKASKVDFLRDYNELQSDSNTINDNNANAKNKNLKTIIGKKPAELDSSGYSAKMIVNRAKAMSCSGFYQDSNGAEITLNVNQLKSQSFVYVDEQGTLSLELIEQCLSDWAVLLTDYWQKTVEKWRFAEVDISGAHNNFGGYYNAPNHPNYYAFATLQDDGSITAWGRSDYGGTGAPNGNDYTKIYSTSRAFVALKADGSIKAWGAPGFGTIGVPDGKGYTNIYSNKTTFAVLKADGSIASWGSGSRSTPSDIGGYTYAPSDSGYIKIYSTAYAFAAIKADGSIKAWGHRKYGGAGAPSDKGYTKIYSNNAAFAALKADGSIASWGFSEYGGVGAPSDKGYTKIYSNEATFVALKADGSITTWGYSEEEGTGAPSDSGYTKIYSTRDAFAALKADGSITAWGGSDSGGIGAPFDNGYTNIYSNRWAFAALKADGSITAWGRSNAGGIGAPSDNGYIKIYSTKNAFAALKADGSIASWGSGSTGASSDSGYTKIYSTYSAFVAVKVDGSIVAWGDSNGGGTIPASISNPIIYRLKPLNE
ncbi:hypothetical protein BSPWISOXPB_656 [uncultured Gammaproteobacteria bacterium]|nr:hypothetical protein BSPWISOXPB_656 [uncultured Gammaproteobacteria bacterium]